ncbi:MAG: beta-N-acetylhexosaminidase, partial [Alteromonadales bacterium]|nr:beta-N-acetylhexosaminidase [Alteromonadales bacterium]
IIISDDLSMHGASFVGDHVTRANSALQAGCDLILACNNSDAAISILDALPIPNIQDSHAVIEMSYKKDEIRFPLQKNPIWIKNHQNLMQFADRV